METNPRCLLCAKHLEIAKQYNMYCEGVTSVMGKPLPAPFRCYLEQETIPNETEKAVILERILQLEREISTRKSEQGMLQAHYNSVKLNTER